MNACAGLNASVDIVNTLQATPIYEELSQAREVVFLWASI